MIIRTKSFPRAALIGNPSDGYHGKTIAFLFRNFSVDVTLTESPVLNLIPGTRDKTVYKSTDDLITDIHLYGYYGGIRLLKATIKKFTDYCRDNVIVIPDRNFTLQYESDIPKRLGLAGSSAIITAVLRAISQFYQVEIPEPVFANLVLAAETEELSISAGLQDRVAQAFELPVYMDFDEEIMRENGYGYYETFSADLLPDLFIAFSRDLAEGSEVVHNDLRERFEAGNREVIDAMHRFASLTSEAYEALKNGHPEKLGALMNENFDLRKSICPISTKNLKMVELARSAGATAKFTGSGGAIIGTYANETIYDKLSQLMHSHNIEVIKPQIVEKIES